MYCWVRKSWKDQLRTGWEPVSRLQKTEQRPHWTSPHRFSPVFCGFPNLEDRSWSQSTPLRVKRPDQTRLPNTRQDDDNRPKRCIWCCLGPMWVFFLTKLTICCIYRYLSTTYVTGRATRTRTGPNDASGVVWALGELFFLCFLYSKLMNYSIYRFYLRHMRQRGQQWREQAQMTCHALFGP